MAIIQSGASADQLTIGATSKAARVTLYNEDGTPIYPLTTPLAYRASSLTMTLGTLAANSCIFALNNPAASGKNLIITRAMMAAGFSGVAAATFVSLGMMRATGTAAGGTGNKSAATIGKRNPADANSVASVYWGPAAITGLTDDAVADIRSVFINHQNSAPQDFDLLGDTPHNESDSDGTIILPGTSLIIRNRNISVAGSNVAINVEWIEK